MTKLGVRNTPSRGLTFLTCPLTSRVSVLAVQYSMSTGSLDSLEPPWAQLVAIDLETEESDDFIPIVGDEFTIGRGKGDRLLGGGGVVCIVSPMPSYYY